MAILGRSGQARPDCSDSLTLDLPACSCLVLLAPEKFQEFKVESEEVEGGDEGAKDGQGVEGIWTFFVVVRMLLVAMPGAPSSARSP